MINVNFTHVNDYLVLKLGTIGLSGHFFSEVVEKKSVNVDNGMISTNCGCLLYCGPFHLLLWRCGHLSGLCWLRPSWFLRIHTDLVKRRRNAGRELQIYAHLPASLCSTPHNPGVSLAAETSFHFSAGPNQKGFHFPLSIPIEFDFTGPCSWLEPSYANLSWSAFVNQRLLGKLC